MGHCTSCGACCAHFRVSFYWGECQSGGGLVPDELVVQISHKPSGSGPAWVTTSSGSVASRATQR